MTDPTIFHNVNDGLVMTHLLSISLPIIRDSVADDFASSAETNTSGGNLGSNLKDKPAK